MTSPSSPAAAALLNEALDLHRAGRLEDAASIYRRLLADDPGHADAAHLLGLVHFRNHDFDSAIRLIREAIEREPDNPIFQGNLGNVLKDAARPAEAVAAYRRALELDPRYAEIHNNLGYLLCVGGMIDEGIGHYREAIGLRPKNFRPHYNLGNALFATGKGGEAVAALREATRLNPGFAEAWDHLGTALQRLGRGAEAEASFRRWIEIEPESADAFHALALELQRQGRIDEAFEGYRRALALRPDLLPATASALWLAQRMCDWTAVAAYSDVVLRRATEDPRSVSPFQLMSLPAASRAHLLAHARALSATIAPDESMRHDRASFGHGSRLRVGYLSSDFHGHPVAYLTAEVFELHDRERFEVFLFSYGPDDGSAIRRRLAAGCDRFIDLSKVSDGAAAQRIRDERIQILVDLKGYTADDRPGIAACRPAPIQVNWLGFPGTMGAGWIDYLIADATIVPREHDADYAEKIVRLPHCYQPNDRKRPSAASLSRSACGLPETAVVFCCFNQTYKVEARLFAAWMRLLSRVPDSVLWLLEENRWAGENLRKAAERDGVSPERCIFAPIRPLAEHLERYSLADLVLDTFPYTSHTTGSDALWAGCPMVTVMGETFASRVAASLLVNVGLGQLIAGSLAEYESLALGLAQDRPRLEALRRYLREQRDSLPLFDSPRFTQELESAYRHMWQRFAHASGPEAFDQPQMG
ncbi:MAG TPA: tetratricopeptide repeat protein [Casimicrobiaceae bacterium]|nr:tetratricopeptide repeat protein [Casimicrobiaceae bacterium]